MDTLFRTVKHPKEDALALSLGVKPMPDFERKRSEELTKAILEKRGREALSSDDARGGEGLRRAAPAPPVTASVGSGASGAVERKSAARSSPSPKPQRSKSASSPKPASRSSPKREKAAKAA